MRIHALVAAGLVCLAAPPAPQAEPANTLAELWRQLQACLVNAPGSDALANGSEVTILFAMKRDGSLFGKPRITHSDLRGQAGDQEQFLANVLMAIDHCLPLDVTPGLGGAIAGRPIALRVIKGRWQFGA